MQEGNRTTGGGEVSIAVGGGGWGLLLAVGPRRIVYLPDALGKQVCQVARCVGPTGCVSTLRSFKIFWRCSFCQWWGDTGAWPWEKLCGDWFSIIHLPFVGLSMDASSIGSGVNLVLFVSIFFPRLTNKKRTSNPRLLSALHIVRRRKVIVNFVVRNRTPLLYICQCRIWIGPWSWGPGTSIPGSCSLPLYICLTTCLLFWSSFTPCFVVVVKELFNVRSVSFFSRQVVNKLVLCRFKLLLHNSSTFKRFEVPSKAATGWMKAYDTWHQNSKSNFCCGVLDLALTGTLPICSDHHPSALQQDASPFWFPSIASWSTPTSTFGAPLFNAAELMHVAFLMSVCPVAYTRHLLCIFFFFFTLHTILCKKNCSKAKLADVCVEAWFNTISKVFAMFFFGLFVFLFFVVSFGCVCVCIMPSICARMSVSWPLPKQFGYYSFQK